MIEINNAFGGEYLNNDDRIIIILDCVICLDVLVLCKICDITQTYKKIYKTFIPTSLLKSTF